VNIQININLYIFICYRKFMREMRFSLILLLQINKEKQCSMCPSHKWSTDVYSHFDHCWIAPSISSQVTDHAGRQLFKSCLRWSTSSVF